MLRSISCSCSPYTVVLQQVRPHRALGFLPEQFPSEAVLSGGGQLGDLLRDAHHLSDYGPKIFSKGKHGKGWYMLYFILTLYQGSAAVYIYTHTSQNTSFCPVQEINNDFQDEALQLCFFTDNIGLRSPREQVLSNNRYLPLSSVELPQQS